MVYKNPWQQPKQDTGWGLIYRLNFLMGQIEHDIENGDLEKWNLHLDRIYVNILFKNDEEIIYDENDNVVDVKFSEEDTKVFKVFASKIEACKMKMIESSKIDDEEERRKVLHSIKKELYNILFKKDIWIRKKMYKLKLYLRESEHDPRRAIYEG